MDKLINLSGMLARQKRANDRDGVPGEAIRRDRLSRAIALLVENQGELCSAMSADFGSRSVHQSLMGDLLGAVASLEYARKHVASWVKPEKRKVQFPLGLFGARAEVRYQPKGVVGSMSTWNFPVWVPFSSLAGIFAAGNRCMFRLSEVVPETSGLIESLTGQYFDEEELVAVTGDERLASEFSRLPFDHLLFTGSSAIGKKVMLSAAENLVPVTLELGGKSPVVIGKKVDLAKVAESVVVGKLFNAGQVCTSPDYVFVRSASLNEFIAEIERAVARLFPTMLENPDYTSLINQQHFERMNRYLEDARSREGEVWEINPARENFFSQEGVYKMPLSLVVEPEDDMLVMQEEIFGPVLPIKSYGHIDDVIDFIRSRPKPLALYFYGKDQDEREALLSGTSSGGVAIGDVMQQVGCEDLPFGGIGDSGMGHYHGVEGFRNFSHARSVYRQSSLNMMALSGLLPPYSEKAFRFLEGMLKK
jgi:coniferyl-aldehyde dehydrogenase